MAQTATLFNLETQIADVDRGVYETVSLRIARQASETPEFMITRWLAYCLEFTEGIAFTEGVASGDDPAVLARDLTGKLTSWIEVGMPSAERVHRGSKKAERVAVYTHRPLTQVLAQLNGQNIFRAGEIPVFSFSHGLVERAAAIVGRRASLALSVTERQVFLDVDGTQLNAEIIETRLS
jgi:uncharacterized protein YaeQ